MHMRNGADKHEMENYKMSVKELKDFAAHIRIATLEAIGTLGHGHVGGCLSICDVLAVLYAGEMKIDAKNPDWEDRDWLVVSKGHAGPAVYATLALKGYFDKDVLSTLNCGGTTLPSHCDRTKTPGIDMTAGSLGQGLSAAAGIALGLQKKGKKNYVYCIVGDGESQEGQIWEAVLFAPQKKLNNLICFIDDNKQQLDGYTSDIMNVEDMEKKFGSFNWFVQSIDGHDLEQISSAIHKAKESGKAAAIILNTKKGMGADFAMNRPDNHHMHVDMKDIKFAIAKLESTL